MVNKDVYILIAQVTTAACWHHHLPVPDVPEACPMSALVSIVKTGSLTFIIHQTFCSVYGTLCKSCTSLNRIGYYDSLDKYIICCI